MDHQPIEESALQAAKAGRIQFLGRPCKKCGGTVRYTSSRQCVACTKARATADQQAIRSALAKAKGQP